MSLASDFRALPEFLRGRNGEVVVAEWLKARGWYVIPSYDYSGEDGNKAPRMEGALAAFVLPDLDIARDGQRLWAEVKTKAQPTLHRKTNILEHGISLRLFRQYQQVGAVTGCEIWLFVYEEDSGLILSRRLGCDADGRIYDGAKMGRGGMIFWPRHSFAVVGKISETTP